MSWTCLPALLNDSDILAIDSGLPSRTSNGSRRKSTCWMAQLKPAERKPLSGFEAMPTMPMAEFAMPRPALTQSPRSMAEEVFEMELISC